MPRALVRTGLAVTAAAVLASGVVVLPRGYEAARLLAGGIDDAAAVDYRLQQLPAQTIAAEIEAAHAAEDYPLAQSLLVLADRKGVAIEPALRAAVEAGPPFNLLELPGAAFNCITTRTLETDQDLACLAASDLTGVGDVADIVREGGALVAGQDYDGVTLGIATVGLAVTAATIGTAGALWPARLGASFVKAANKSRHIPPALLREMGDTVAGSVNPRAVEEVLDLARQGRLGELGAPAARVLDGKALGRLVDTSRDIGTVAQAGGVRALNATFEVADNANDLRRAASVATHSGKGYLGVLKLLGAGVLGVAGVVFTLGGWVATGLGWLLAAGAAMLWVLRQLWRLARRRPRAAAAHEVQAG